MPSIISSNQCAFLKRNSILDGVLVANVCIDSRERYGYPRFICTIDMEKAYDHANSGCLDYVMHIMSFGIKWSWMRKCYESSFFFFFSLMGF